VPVGDPVGDDRAGGVPRTLDLPHQHADGPAPVVEVVDHAALGVVVHLEHLQGRVERADGLPAHPVHHRVEVRGVVVGGVGAGHRAPGGGAGFARVVDMLDAGTAEDRIGVFDDVTGRPDRGVGGAQVLVDHDALGDLETRLAGQVEAGLGAQADHHEVAAHGRAVVKGDADVRIVLHGDLCGAVAGQQLDAVVGEQLLVPLGDA